MLVFSCNVFIVRLPFISTPKLYACQAGKRPLLKHRLVFHLSLALKSAIDFVEQVEERYMLCEKCLV